MPTQELTRVTSDLIRYDALGNGKIRASPQLQSAQKGLFKVRTMLLLLLLLLRRHLILLLLLLLLLLRRRLLLLWLLLLLLLLLLVLVLLLLLHLLHLLHVLLVLTFSLLQGGRESEGAGAKSGRGPPAR